MKTRYKQQFLFFISILSLFTGRLFAQEASKTDWIIGAQAYTFKLYTLEEALQKMQRLGLTHVELYPNQKLSRGSEDMITHFAQADENLEPIKTLLAKYGITPYAYGVVKPKSKTEWEQVFTFAKALGVGVINAEPLFSELDFVEELCRKHQIRIALHNHPVPTSYWHPKTVQSLLDGRSEWVGVCADIGHWVRSGVSPIDGIDLLGPRIMGFHFKDINAFGDRKAHDVPWGTGYCNIAGVMNEMKNRGFKGFFTVEYEYNWEDNMEEIAESIAYYQRVLAQMQAR